MLPANTKRMNRQHLLFDSISKGLSRVKGKEDFVALAKKLCPKDVLAIEDFERSYQLKLPAADAHRQIIDWAMRDWFCWKLIEAIPKSTTDPRRLAYIRLPFGDLFVAIEQSYRQMVSLPQTLWIVVSLSVQEREKLRSVDPGTFFLFTSFIRGFTRENEARV